MLVNLAAPTTFTHNLAQAQPAAVGLEQAVRSDLPPIKQAPDSGATQNQAAPQFAQQGSPQQLKAEAGSAGAKESSSNEDSFQAAQQAKQKQQTELQEQQQKEDDALISQLRARDREVRLHEAAHASVGGKYAGSPSLDFTRGPDGVSYASGGEVSISVSEVAGNPQSTIEKARVIKAAALAPAEPSAQDRRVAAQASQLEVEAREDIQVQERNESAEAKEAREEKRKAALEEQQAVEPEVAEEEAKTVEEPVVAAPVATTVDTSKSADSASQETEEEDTSAVSEADTKNAKEELEEILLSTKSVPKALNDLGLVDANNPYGESGFIEYIV